MGFQPGLCPLWVGKSQVEQIISALPLGADMTSDIRNLRDVPLTEVDPLILFQRDGNRCLRIPLGKMLRSITIDFDDRFGKGLRGFLRQIVPDAALDDPVRIFAGEFLGIGAGVRVWCAIGITFKGDGGHGDDRTFGKPLFQIVIFRLAFSQAEPPAVIMDHDGDVIRVVEGRRAAIERGIVEVPLRRSELPDELRKVVPVFVVAGPAAFGGKIILVPPLRAQPLAATASCRLAWLPIR